MNEWNPDPDARDAAAAREAPPSARARNPAVSFRSAKAPAGLTLAQVHGWAFNLLAIGVDPATPVLYGPVWRLRRLRRVQVPGVLPLITVLDPGAELERLIKADDDPDLYGPPET